MHRIRSIQTRMPVLLEDGFLYLLGRRADPLGLGDGERHALEDQSLVRAIHAHGKRDRAVTQPVNTTCLPSTPPQVLIVDAEANPKGYTKGDGALWKWDPTAPDFQLVVADSTFRNPRAAVPISDHEVLLLDSEADPFDFVPGPGPGPGAIYYVDTQSKTVRPYFSDSLLRCPVTRCPVTSSSTGGEAYSSIDSDADPGDYGFPRRRRLPCRSAAKDDDRLLRFGRLSRARSPG